jgi:hypothetical protein
MDLDVFMGLGQELVEIGAEREGSHLVTKIPGDANDYQQYQQASFNDKVG